MHHPRKRLILPLLMILVAGGSEDLSGQAQSSDVTIIADQIRSQGFPCTNPRSAEPVASMSKPEKPAYLLTCDNAKYQVRLVPDQGAEVTEVK